MNKLILATLGLGTLAVALTTADDSLANGVTATKDDCRNAHALIATSTGGDHGRMWQAIKGTIDNMGYVTVKDEAPSGEWGSASLREYDTTHVEDGTAYVVHCGHGGTCNAIAKRVAMTTPSVGAPVVYCGIVPTVLNSPRSPQD